MILSTRFSLASIEVPAVATKTQTSGKKPNFLLEELLSSEECATLITTAQDQAWRDARVVSASSKTATQREDQDVRSAQITMFAPASRSARKLIRKFEMCLRAKCEKTFGLFSDRYSEVQILRYEQGDFFLPHTDSGSLNENRALTVVTYLNENYHGGETRFCKYGYDVAPKIGKTLIFPSDMLHEAKTVTSGTKYTAVFWILEEPSILWL